MMAGQLTSLDRPDQSDSNYLELFARLPENTGLSNAQAAGNVVFQLWLSARRGTWPQGTSSVRPALALTPMPRGLSLLRGQYSEPLAILMISVVLLLLIACANVATLLLARATSRRREIAVRLSVGAGRSRIVRQMLTEAVLVSILGGFLGWIASIYLGRVMLIFLPANAVPWQFSPSIAVFLFAMSISIVNGVFFGIAPALLVSRTYLVAAIKSDISMPINRVRGLNLRGALSVVQVALSLMLIVVAGLFTRTLQNLRTTDMGFRRTNLVLASLDPAKNGYRDERLLSFFDQIQQSVREQPGVAEVALARFGTLTAVLPAGTSRFLNSSVHAEGQDPVPGEDLTTYFNTVFPGYFSTVGLSIVAGRDFGPQDRPGSGKVVIINEAAARYWFPAENPIGKRIGVGAAGPADMVIIGVVKNAKYLSLREKTRRIVYRPFSQAPSSPMTLHVRTTGNAAAIVPYIRRAVQKVDVHVPLFHLQTIESRVDDSLRQERLVSTLASMLGFLGTVLAGIGVYGLVSYSVAQRTREIGTCMALGATPRQVAGTFVRKALVITLGGIVIGIPLSLVITRVFSGFLYGLGPADPSAIIAPTTILFALAAIVALLPALRAARVDPSRALRQE